MHLSELMFSSQKPTFGLNLIGIYHYGNLCCKWLMQTMMTDDKYKVLLLEDFTIKTRVTSCDGVTPAVTPVPTCNCLLVITTLLCARYSGWTTPIFKLDLHFDLIYTPVKFHEYLKSNVGKWRKVWGGHTPIISATLLRTSLSSAFILT